MREGGTPPGVPPSCRPLSAACASRAGCPQGRSCAWPGRVHSRTVSADSRIAGDRAMGAGMSGMLGMDTQEVLRHSDAVWRAEGMLRARIDHLDRTISGLESFWQGPDAEAFRSAWVTVHHEAVASHLERLRRSADELSRHADEQEHASAADGGGAEPAGDGDPLAVLPSFPGVAFDPGDGVTTTNDPAIQAAWDEMSEAERRAVLRQIVDDEVTAYGMNEHLLPDVEVRFMPGWVSGGAISLEGGVIYLSSDLLDSPYGLQIAAHEARHQV